MTAVLCGGRAHPALLNVGTRFSADLMVRATAIADSHRRGGSLSRMDAAALNLTTKVLGYGRFLFLQLESRRVKGK